MIPDINCNTSYDLSNDVDLLRLSMAIAKLAKADTRNCGHWRKGSELLTKFNVRHKKVGHTTLAYAIYNAYRNFYIKEAEYASR